jgi:hypothetical protein
MTDSLMKYVEGGDGSSWLEEGTEGEDAGALVLRGGPGPRGGGLAVRGPAGLWAAHPGDNRLSDLL